MMDPFEARLKFQQMLKSLTCSNTNNLNVSKFAITNSELQEDFHSCILEVLENSDLNHKLNLFQFFEVLILQSLQVSSRPYISNFVRDFYRIFEIILNDDNANLNSSFLILFKISNLLGFTKSLEYKLKFSAASKELISDEDMSFIEQDVPFIKTNYFMTHELPIIDNYDDIDQVFTKVWEYLLLKKKQSKYERIRKDKHIPLEIPPASSVDDVLPSNQSSSINADQSQLLNNSTTITTTNIVTNIVTPKNGNSNKDEKLILRRMEDDRERTKKSKEKLWENPYVDDLQLEFNECFQKINYQPDLEDEEFKELEEVNLIVAQCYDDWGGGDRIKNDKDNGNGTGTNVNKLKKRKFSTTDKNPGGIRSGKNNHNYYRYNYNNDRRRIRRR
ncbi:hypothetical protein PACTADRAFT_48449 [Pachysolen tannophilus NRRL Y-2460]|uniref:CID domain-containing protein n=1 Tax=Pachysolen tannophilus NRRL Y-2460 TaxID=669874 RepID=A0A1E4TXY2_PACTA|nr:hypothetical protein PACTADRAFT_48449 [Pachysolen tannophilus NRRL Y-2460]